MPRLKITSLRVGWPHGKLNSRLTGQGKISIMRTFDTLLTKVGRLREKVRCAHFRTVGSAALCRGRISSFPDSSVGRATDC